MPTPEMIRAAARSLEENWGMHADDGYWNLARQALIAAEAASPSGARIHKLEAEQVGLKQIAYERWEIANARIRELEADVKMWHGNFITSQEQNVQSLRRVRELEEMAEVDAAQRLMQNAYVKSIEVATIERCAQVAEVISGDVDITGESALSVHVAYAIAKAIRALKPTVAVSEHPESQKSE